MEWWSPLVLLVGALLVLLASGMPVAFVFLLINLAGFTYFVDPQAGPNLLALSIYDSLTKFSLIPVPLFILMGEVMFHSGMAVRALDAVGYWLGRVPGRLSVLAGASGVMFAALSGSTMANTAMLGTLLLPEMRRRGYSKEMSIGPIIGAGGLAMMIPPSALAVLLGSLGHISIGRLLVAIVPAGLLMGALYLAYTIGRCWLQPGLAPAYEFESVSLRVKVVALVRDVLPLGVIIFLVIGLMTLGLATPTESAALGAVGTFGLAVYYRRFSWAMLKASLLGTLSVTVMTFMILSGSAGYSQLLAFTGVTSGVVGSVMDMALAPIVVMIGMQVVLLILGMFIDQVSMMLVTLPLYMPIATALGWDPVWFGVIMLINLEVGLTTPPFGMLNFVMKGVAPPDVTIQDIWKAGFPYIVCDLVAMAVVIAVPAFVLWLPAMMLR